MDISVVAQVPTFWANLHVGLRPEFDGEPYSVEFARGFIEPFATEKGLFLSVTKTTYIYPRGSEPGIVIGFIHYPSQQIPNRDLLNNAIQLGKLLMKELRQIRVSIITHEETYVLSSE